MSLKESSSHLKITLLSFCLYKKAFQALVRSTLSSKTMAPDTKGFHGEWKPDRPPKLARDIATDPEVHPDEVIHHYL